jgi:hypothetical protein
METIPPNIQRFNLTALVLFDQPYNAFPSPIEIDAIQLGGSAMPEDVDKDQAFDFGAEAHHVITWLEEEGFIRHQGGGIQNTFYQVRLTSKGFDVLNRVPASIAGEPPESIGLKIRKIVGSGVKTAGAEVVKRVVSEVFAAAVKYGTQPAQVGQVFI